MPSRSAQPITLSTALCRPISSRTARNFSFCVKQRRRMQSAGAPENILRVSEPLRQIAKQNLRSREIPRWVGQHAQLSTTRWTPFRTLRSPMPHRNSVSVDRQSAISSGAISARTTLLRLGWSASATDSIARICFRRCTSPSVNRNPVTNSTIVSRRPHRDVDGRSPTRISSGSSLASSSV